LLTTEIPYSFTLPIKGKRVPTDANSNLATFYRSVAGIEHTHSIPATDRTSLRLAGRWATLNNITQ